MAANAQRIALLAVFVIALFIILPVALNQQTHPPTESVTDAPKATGNVNANSQAHADNDARRQELSDMRQKMEAAQAKIQELQAKLDRLPATPQSSGANVWLPSEDEIQKWERIALNFSRAGNTYKWGGEPKPAYPIHLYTKVIKEEGHSVCPNWKRFGDRGDGGWVVCMTPPVVEKRCVAYSFGVGADYSFEKAISKYCEVHSFDPTPHIVAMMKKIEHKINWQFHPWGLDSYPHNGTFQMYTTGDKPVKVRFESLPSVMKVLGHKTVDIVKIDVEGYEVYLWHQLFDPAMGVEQLLFELHPLTRTFTSDEEKKAHGIDASRFFDWTDWLVMLTACFRNGYKPFFAEEGRYNHAGGLQEFSFLRQKLS